ncbi:rho GTPase-activating protein 21 isoform X2 [Polistes fuscatus]|uniref:rho GTPase-activating protein 21 isoform X2 n=1 Tax=Polistes fuscatus TaxID=30207 RepID=UPI001CA92BC4|nr:rho GTPase-activating protein 21 isoform X2 [Polistes fuscatus]
MADDRKNAQRLIGQVHAVRHTSPPPPAPAPTSAATRKESLPLRGPRTLLLRRSENGFGFTLRHFIVYPPESCCMLPGHERTKIDEPMDTIFVKQVRVNSPASEAGLRTGDRVVSVDGIATRGEQYASVVQRIQQAGPWLRLLVVSKEDDILQRYFGETAHNPETNQRPRLRSPERVSQKQRRSISMIPGPSPRTTRQSWICSLPDSENLSTTATSRDSEEVLYKESQGNKMSPSIPVIAGQQRRFLQETNIPCEPVEDRMQSRKLQHQQQVREAMESPPQSYTRPSPDQRFDLYDRTRPESIYSRPSSEQIYDRIKDPIYERVRSGESGGQYEKEQQQLTMLRYPISRAEPQVPIYRPGRRVIARRASEGSGATGQTNESEVPSYGSIDALRSNDPSSRLSMDSRRDSSPISKGSLSSFDSNSTVTGNECSDDSVIMNRLRKSFEQKEEFLRRPSHPIGWSVAEDASRLQQSSGGGSGGGGGGGSGGSGTNSAVIQREFYARPQKLQRQIWPPNEQQQRQQSPTRRMDNKSNGKLSLTKPSNQNVQRVKIDLDSESDYNNSRSEQNDDRSNLVDSQISIRDRFYSSLYESQLGKENHFVYPPIKTNDQDRYKANNKSVFVSTLSKIHENASNSIATNQQQQLQQHPQDSRNESLSVPSSPGLDKKNNDKFVVPPQGLQIVSRRAKQFESGRLLSDDEEPTSDRTNLYKSELSRLSNKRSVPNVAVMKREFESKAESQEPRRIPANRESKSLDSEIPTMEIEAVHLRARSNSAESWEAVNGSRGNTRHTWQTEQEEDEKDNRNDNNNGDSKNQSYGQSPRSQLAPCDETSNNGVILRRQKNAQLSDEERATRRVSYLKATWGERMHVDSDLDLSDTEPVHVLRSNSIVSTTDSGNEIPKEVEPVEREGTLHIKFTVLDGKRSSDRSWKQIWGVLRGPILFFYKDRHSQSPSSVNDTEGTVQNIDVRCSLVDIAEDYTKRKHVLRVVNPTAEVLLQTEDAASMALWLRALHKYAATEKPLDVTSSTSKQQAVPQTPGPTTPSVASVQNANQRLSPLPSHKGIKKLTSFRNRSPTGQSPVNKTRKPSQTMEPLSSPKTKTWKGRVAKQFRKMHGQQAGSPSSPTAQLPPEGATFKVPLELCPSSSFSEFVPLIVEMCTSIVEARGLEVVGIYRVPGNTAAISQLTESVNKGFENINLQDPRWSDVNVISSLLKSFFRQLPDSLLTAELYPMFIDADKIEDPQRRMATIRKLLRDLPEHHFETLKYLMFHLKRIVEHSEVNKMEAKNIAIVFGPTLVRASGSRDNMVTMVTDMSHQCKIVESLLNNVDWFFSEEDLDDLSRLSVNISLPADGCELEPTSHTNHNLLLNNIQKVEANRKIQRRRKGQDEAENEEHDEEKVKIKHESSESSPTIRQSMALNERQCSVSEIVLMHENKSQHNHSNNSSEPLERSSSTNNNSPVSASSSSSRSKYSNQHVGGVSSSSESSSRPLSEAGLSCLDTNSMTSNASNENKQSNDEVAIRTYAGLSATTQERIRRFEQETKAMLQRDQHRQRREAEKREEERRRIDKEWQLAKREMENDDLLDSIVDSTVIPNFLSGRLTNVNQRLAEKSLADLSEKHARSRSTTRMASTPLSIAVQQQPTTRQKAQATNQLSNVLGEKINNGVIKKFKTDQEPSLESICLPPIRYGSLDSLHEVHNLPHSSPSPSQQRRGISGDVSDDAGSCFLHWTQKILTINKKLSRHTTSPGFWCYISSHLHGTTGSSGTTTKTSLSSSADPASTGVNSTRSLYRSSISTATASAAAAATTVPTTNSRASSQAAATAAAAATQSFIPGHLSEMSRSAGSSGSGPGAPSKTLNRFLRGSDLLTSLTTTFDRKWRSLVNPSSQIVQTSVETAPLDNVDNSDDQKKIKVEDQPEKNQPTEKVYRDPSLHKSSIDKNHFLRAKDEALEKDTDSTVTEVHDPDAMTKPDNDRNAIKLETKNVLNHVKETNATITDSTKKDEDKKKEESDNATTKEGGGCGSSNIRKSTESENKTDDKKVHELDTNYSNKLEKFEILTNNEERSRLKRSESLNKRSENTFSKLKRSESLNKHSERLASPTNSKLKRSESLNKHSDRSESPNSKLKRSESLTKTEKTECNISKRRQSVRKDSATKLKRKNGMPERSLKRRHTVGGTKDFDKVHWLDNKLQSEAERVIKNDYKPKKSQLRTSSPDLSTNRVNVPADTSFLIEVSFRGPSNVVFNVTNARPQSLPDANLASKVFKVPLESHV